MSLRKLTGLWLVTSSLISSGVFAQDSHSNSTPADYERVFDREKVHILNIEITPTDYAAMQADMTDILGAPGSSSGGPGGGGGGGGGFGGGGGGAPGAAPGGAGGGGGPGGAGGDLDSILSRDPIWVNTTVSYEGETWQNVGLRYKGNSSLSSLWRQGNRKLPFKFNFSKFESDKIPKQKFFGFKKITFAPNYGDDSQIRDAYVADLLRSEGIPSARWAFVRVFVDVGTGPQYWGLYTMLEEVDDGALLNREFGSKSGNLYKPSGTGSDWTSFTEAGFGKENNEEENDFSDVIAAVGSLLEVGPGEAGWRTKLESTFEVQAFLKWLAVNTLIKNWDAYGQMAHNYYLYADPALDNRLVWIPWDHNLSMQDRGSSATTTAADDIFHQKVTARWPLISRLLADPVYKASYTAYVETALTGLFELEATKAHMQKLHDQIAPYITGAEGEEAKSTTIKSAAAFDSSLTGTGGLFNFVAKRHSAAKEALSK